MADTGSSAVAVVGDPNLGCLRYLDTSDRCDTDRHVECLYGSGGWRGVDCHREVAVQGAHRAPHWQALAGTAAPARADRSLAAPRTGLGGSRGAWGSGQRSAGRAQHAMASACHGLSMAWPPRGRALLAVAARCLPRDACRAMPAARCLPRDACRGRTAYRGRTCCGCPSQVVLGGLEVRGYELAAVTWEQAFLMCPASPDEGQGTPLRPDMLIEGIFGLSLFGLRRGTLRARPTQHAHHAHHAHHARGPPQAAAMLPAVLPAGLAVRRPAPLAPPCSLGAALLALLP